MNKLLIIFLMLTISTYSKVGVYACKQMSKDWYALVKIAEKAFYEKHDLRESVKAKELSVEVAQIMVDKCSIEYWNIPIYNGDDSNGETRRKNMIDYIDSTKKDIKKFTP